MEQTRFGSLIEALLNTFIGYAVALISQLLVFPLFAIQVPFTTNLLIGAWFTVISVIRSYVVRRWFNAKLHRLARRLAESQ